MSGTAAKARNPRGIATILLGALVLVHAGLVAVAVSGGAPGRPDWARYAVVAGAALAIAAVGRYWPDRIASAGLAFCVVLAIAVVGPLPVLGVALIAAAAAVTGVRVVAWATRRGDRDVAADGLALPTIAGLAIAIGLFAATAPFRIHAAGTYAVLLVLPLVAFPGATRAALARAQRWQGAGRWSPGERWWIVTLTVVAVLHVFVVAKPEVGYDASAMHLQFAAMVARDGRWAHDVGRFVWAVMPLGADHLFAAAYLLAGEPAARLANLAAGAIGMVILYEIARRVARREAALAAVALFASAPLAFVETVSLFSEPLWLAFLLATLLSAMDWPGDDSRTSVVLALAAAGAMQAKVISVLWLAPLAAGLAAVALAFGRPLRVDRRAALAIALAAAIGAWPYANAWVRTGNPVFPFMNAVFGSPLFGVDQSFNNPLFNAPLRWSTPYDIVLSSRSYLEGRNGSLGFHWLLLYPLIACAFVRRPSRAALAILALGVAFFVGVYVQQSYLRYLLPAFALLTILGAHALSALPAGARVAVGVRAAGTLLVLLNLHFIGAGGYGLGTLCPTCGIHADARAGHVLANAPIRAVGDFLNRRLPEPRVAFLVANDPSPAGFTGYSRSLNWHDDAFFRAIPAAHSAEDVLAVVRSYSLDHAVFRTDSHGTPEHAIAEFRACCTEPVAQIGPYEIARVVSP